MQAMKSILFLVSLTLLFSPYVYAGSMSISAGYGFGFLNAQAKPYRLTYTEGLYDFFHLAVARETQIWKQICSSLEPFILYQKRPKEGIDVGLTLAGKYYIQHFFISVGVGLAYTTYGFKEQGTHLPFVLHVGIGYKFGKFFLENRIKHYSNAGLARPNVSINANLAVLGIHFR